MLQVNSSLLNTLNSGTAEFFNLIPQASVMRKDSEDIQLLKESLNKKGRSGSTNLVVKWLIENRENTLTLTSELIDSALSPKLDGLRLNDWSDFNVILKEYAVKEYNSLTRYNYDKLEWESFSVSDYYSSKIPYVLNTFLQIKGTRTDLNYLLSKTKYESEVEKKHRDYLDYDYTGEELGEVRKANTCFLAIALNMELVENDPEKYSGYPDFLSTLAPDDLSLSLIEILEKYSDKMVAFDRAFEGLMAVRFSVCFGMATITGKLLRREKLSKPDYDPNDWLYNFSQVDDEELKLHYLSVAHNYWFELKTEYNLYSWLHHYDDMDGGVYMWHYCDEAMFGAVMDKIGSNNSVLTMDENYASESEVSVTEPYDVPKMDEQIEPIRRVAMTVKVLDKYRLIWYDSRYRIMDDVSVSFTRPIMETYDRSPGVGLVKCANRPMKSTEITVIIDKVTTWYAYYNRYKVLKRVNSAWEAIYRQMDNPSGKYYFNTDEVMSDYFRYDRTTSESNPEVVDWIIYDRKPQIEGDSVAKYYIEYQKDEYSESDPTRLLARRIATEMLGQGVLKTRASESYDFRKTTDGVQYSESGLTGTLLMDLIDDIDKKLTYGEVSLMIRTLLEEGANEDTPTSDLRIRLQDIYRRLINGEIH